MKKHRSFLRKKSLLLSSCFILAVSVAEGQTIAGWDFSTQTQSGVSPLTATTTAANISASGLTRGSGLLPWTNSNQTMGGYAFNSTSKANAISGNKFFYFTVNANTGYTISLSNISFTTDQLSGFNTAGSLVLQYSIDGSNYTDINTYTINATFLNNVSESLSGITDLQNVPAATTVTFRIVAWGGAANNAGSGVYITNVNAGTADDFILTGTVSAVSTGSSATDLFRSRQSGDFSDMNTWESSSNGGSTWINATLAPDYQSAGITIQATHTVTVTTDVTIDQLTVDNNGQLDVDPDVNLLFNNGTGDEITNNGTFRLLSTSSSNTARLGDLNGGSIAGNVTIQQFIPGKRAFRFFGNPFTASIALSQLTDDIDITGNGGAANGFTPTLSNAPSAFSFNNGTAAWDAFINTTGNDWEQYEGIRLLVRGGIGEGLDGSAYTPSDVTVDLTGNVNQGTQNINFSGTGFHLVANPMPAPVDVSTLTFSGFNSICYYWLAGITGTNGKGGYISQPCNSSFALPVMSSFFVNATSGAASITVEESDKLTSGSNTTSYKTTSGFGPNSFEMNVEDMDGNFWDRILLFFNPQSTAGFDAMIDGIKFANPDLDFYTLATNSQQLSVDNRPYVSNSFIPLGIHTALDHEFVFHIKSMDVPANVQLWLKDAYTNTLTPVTTGTIYNFTVNSSVPASTGDNRFRIITGTQTEVNEIPQTNMQLQLQLYPNPATTMLNIHVNAAVEEHASLSILNTAGEKVATAMLDNVKDQTVRVPVNHLPAGVYMIRITGATQTFTQTFTKQ